MLVSAITGTQELLFPTSSSPTFGFDIWYTKTYLATSSTNMLIYFKMIIGWLVVQICNTIYLAVQLWLMIIVLFNISWLVVPLSCANWQHDRYILLAGKHSSGRYLVGNTFFQSPAGWEAAGKHIWFSPQRWHNFTILRCKNCVGCPWCQRANID